MIEFRTAMISSLTTPGQGSFQGLKGNRRLDSGWLLYPREPAGVARASLRVPRQQHVPHCGAAGLYFASQPENQCRAVGPDVWQRSSRLPASTPGALAPQRLRFQVRPP